MATRYHINPETGRPGECTATVKDCAYAKDGMLPEHYDTLDEALDAYEAQNKSKTFSPLEKPANTSEKKTVVIEQEDDDTTVVEDDSDISAELVEVENIRGALSAEVKSKVNKQAVEWVNRISQLSPSSTEFESYARNIHKVGQEAFVSTSKIAQEYLSDKKGKKEKHDEVGKNLARLRNSIEKITPQDRDLNVTSKALGIFRRSPLKQYMNRFDSDKGQLVAIADSLKQNQVGLAQKNQHLRLQREQIIKDLGTLQESAELLKNVDQNVVKKIAEEKTNGNYGMAKELEQKVLFNVRQRRQDVATQMVASTHSYISMGVVEETNEQLIQEVDRTSQTTLTIISTQQQIARALDQQKQVSDAIGALKKTSSNALQANAKMLNQNAKQIQEHALSASVDVEVLKNSFDDMFKTLDEMDNFRATANETIDQQIGQLEQVISKAGEYAHQRQSRIDRELTGGDSDILSIEK